MTRAAVRIALLCAGIAGCASLRAERGPDPEEQLGQGLAALAVQDFARARALLEPVYRQHWEEPVGQRAMLALAASELDSRNPARRLWYASDVAGRYLGIAGTPDWTLPLAESLYLLAVELGAQEDSLAKAEADRRQAEDERMRAEQALRSARSAGRVLPQSERETVPARLRKLSGERDELQRRLMQAEQRLAMRERELREAQQELERIRKTIKK